MEVTAGWSLWTLWTQWSAASWPFGVLWYNLSAMRSTPSIATFLALVCSLTFVLMVPQMGFAKERKAKTKTKAARVAKTAASVECVDPSSGNKAQVRISEIREGLARVRRAMQKHGVHILDLPAAVRDRHVNLDKFMEAENWCSVYSQVTDIEGALGMTKIDQAFITAKFARVERWGRKVTEPATNEKVGRLMANAAAQLADGHFEKANGLLNNVIAAIFAINDVWRVPAGILDLDDGEGPVSGAEQITKQEVEEGCPVLGKSGKSNSEEFQKTLTKLRILMNTRGVRPMDYKGGEKLAIDLQNYARLAAYWPAVRIACAMLARTNQIEIDLGVVQKRFLRAKNLKESRGLGAVDEERFKELVRAASDQIMKREFDAAHRSLETLLVLVGEPAEPADTLPAEPSDTLP